jgi:hypothetical protein
VSEANSTTETQSAEYVAFEDFRGGLPLGRFHIIVNPDLARRFVAQRTHATPLAIAIVGSGIASALAGYPVVGVLLVAAGIALRRAIKWQAPKILLHLASRQPAIYHDAAANGVMEVRRV